MEIRWPLICKRISQWDMVFYNLRKKLALLPILYLSPTPFLATPTFEGLMCDKIIYRNRRNTLYSLELSRSSISSNLPEFHELVNTYQMFYII